MCFQFQSDSCSLGLSTTATCEEKLGMVEEGGQKSQTGASAGELNNNTRGSIESRNIVAIAILTH